MAQDLVDIVGKITDGKTFTSDDTWTCPPNVNWILLTMIGGGASGQACASALGGGNPNAAGGPSGEAIFREPIPVVPGNDYDITVGEGGASVVATRVRSDGNQTTTQGNAGTSSSFDGIRTVAGGSSPNQTHVGACAGGSSTEAGEDLPPFNPHGGVSSTIGVWTTGGAKDEETDTATTAYAGGGGAGLDGDGGDGVASASNSSSAVNATGVAPTENTGAGSGGAASYNQSTNATAQSNATSAKGADGVVKLEW